MNIHPYVSPTQAQAIRAARPERRGLYFAIASASIFVLSYVFFVRGVAAVFEANWENSPEGFAAGLVAEIFIRINSTAGVAAAAILAMIGAFRKNPFCYALLLAEISVLVRVVHFLVTAKQHVG